MSHRWHVTLPTLTQPVPRSQEEFCCTQSWSKPTWDTMFRCKPPHSERNIEKLKQGQLRRGLDGEGHEKPGPQALVEGTGAVRRPGEGVTRGRAHLFLSPPKGCPGTKKRDTDGKARIWRWDPPGGKVQPRKENHSRSGAAM